MPHYKVEVYNDMGHVMFSPYDQLPIHICQFVHAKMKQYLLTASDKKNLGAIYYYIPNGMKNKWDYNYGSDVVTIVWGVGYYDPVYMK